MLTVVEKKASQRTTPLVLIVYCTVTIDTPSSSGNLLGHATIMQETIVRTPQGGEVGEKSRADARAGGQNNPTRTDVSDRDDGLCRSNVSQVHASEAGKALQLRTNKSTRRRAIQRAVTQSVPHGQVTSAPSECATTRTWKWQHQHQKHRHGKIRGTSLGRNRQRQQFGNQQVRQPPCNPGREVLRNSSAHFACILLRLRVGFGNPARIILHAVREKVVSYMNM